MGRGGELALIGAFVERACTGGDTLLLFGEPGAGKTALLDAAAGAASDAGTLVLRAAGVEFEADLPFSGLHQVLLPLLDEFGQLSAAHRDALNVALGYGEGPPPDRLLVSTATLTVLRQAAAASPVLVIVDDLPWLDRASAGVLGFVARRLAGSRVGFLAASRPEPESFFERAGLAQHELGPLDEKAASGLVSSRFPELAPRVLQRVLAEAQGNPLALLELPAALSGAQRAAAEALPVVLPLSRRLQGLFASRASALPAPARWLLLLAVLDGSGDLRVLQAAAGQQQIEDLAPAEQAGLVRVDDRTGRLVFRHPLTRSAIVELSTSGDRRRAHRALAAQLADQPERRAWHLGEAAVEPDEQVAGLLEETAQRILRRADAVGAVSALLRAAELSPARADRSRRLAQAASVGASVSLETDTVSPLLSDARRSQPGVRHVPAHRGRGRLRAPQRGRRRHHRAPPANPGHRGSGQALPDQRHRGFRGCFYPLHDVPARRTAGIVDVLSRRYQRVRAGCPQGPVSARSDQRRPGPYRSRRASRGRRRHRQPAQRDGPVCAS